jgi:hypothetical protein
MPIAGLAMGDFGAHEAHAADRTDDVPISGGNAKMMGPRSPVRLTRQQSRHCAGKAFSATYNRIENSLQSTAHERMFPKPRGPPNSNYGFRPDAIFCAPSSARMRPSAGRSGCPILGPFTYSTPHRGG